MENVSRVLLVGLTLFAVVGCAQKGPVDVAAPVAEPGDVVAPSTDATSVEDFDTTTQAQRVAAATAVSSGEHKVGTTVASLGNAASPGFWMETPLVSEAGEGRVEYSATGKSVAVQLIPIDGAETAGSRISLAALRVLGAPLAGLVDLVVFAN